MRQSGAQCIHLLALLGMVMLAVAPAVAAGAATPAATPGGVPGWRFADQRAIDIDGEPISLSPDGRWIAGRGPDNEFCVWDVSRVEPVCGDEAVAIDPASVAWAPDSSAVAFSLDFARLLVDSDIYVFAIGSGKISNLTDDGIVRISMTRSRTGNGPLPIDVYPTWSRDGTELTFARSDWSADALTTTLMTVPAAGGKPSELLELDANSPVLIHSPMHWLEDGTLLYTIWPPDLTDPVSGLWSYEPGDEPIQMVNGSESDEYPIPVATDVFDRNGITVVLGFSPLINAGMTSDPVRSVGFALDVEGGNLVALESLVAIDNAGLTPGEGTTIFAPARFAPDGSALVLGIRTDDGNSLAVASPGTGDAPVSLGIEPKYTSYWAVMGYTWASNDTIMVPLFNGSVVLLTMERAGEEATPPAPCSCTPPP